VPAECFSTDAGAGACSIVRVCRLRGVLAEAVQAFDAVLERYTLADLVQHQRASLARVLMIAPRAGAGPARPPRGSSKVAEPHVLEIPQAATRRRAGAGGTR
jgi:hypothetical protein